MKSLQSHVPRQIYLTIFVKEEVPERGFSFTSKGDLWKLERQHCQFWMWSWWCKPVTWSLQNLFLNWTFHNWITVECLAYFNHFIIFPFLNCVETSSQGELLVILPQLYNCTLQKVVLVNDVIVSIHGMSVPVLSSEALRKIIDMCLSAAAAAIKL